MPRNKIKRKICGYAACRCFKPNKTPISKLPKVALLLDEFEAIRLVDLLGMQQQQAAAQMGVSRQTLANILKIARFKVVDCLAHRKALIMESNIEKDDENSHTS